MVAKKFIEVFDRWAKNYDKSIQIGEKNEDWFYKGYTNILIAIKNEVKKHVIGNKNPIIIDIGAGTGNLLFLMINEGYNPIGVEPSLKMRQEIKRKKSNVTVVGGDFLYLPFKCKSVNAIVSSYAWHHLSNKEKLKSIKEMRRVLIPRSIIVIADLMFSNIKEKKKMLKYLRLKRLYELIEDINSEEWGYVDILSRKFIKMGFETCSKQLTDFVWLLVARDVKL